MYNKIIKFNKYIENLDRRLLYLNLKRALLYIFTKCMAMLDEELEEGQVAILETEDDDITFYLELKSKQEYIDYRDSEKYYSYLYSLHYNSISNIHSLTYPTINDLELLECVCTNINDIVDVKFKVISDNYEEFTDEQHFIIDCILKDFINNTTDDDTPYDLFHSLIVEDNEDEENDS